MVDLQKSPNYEIAILIYLGTTLLTNIYTTFSLIFFVMCNTIAANFDILLEKFRQLKKVKDQNEWKKDVKEVVQQHYETLRVCKLLNTLYSPVFLLQLFYLTILIALQGIQFVLVRMLY